MRPGSDGKQREATVNNGKPREGTRSNRKQYGKRHQGTLTKELCLKAHGKQRESMGSNEKQRETTGSNGKQQEATGGRKRREATGSNWKQDGTWH